MSEVSQNSIKGWTPEEDAYLVKHYNSDRSNQIAASLGRTKNAVIGRAHRLKLGVPLHILRVKRIAKIKAIVAAYKNKPVAPRKPRVAVFRRDGVKLDPTPIAEETVTPLNGVGVKVWDIAPNHCRWVMGEPSDLTYCGHDKASGSPYCETHYKKTVKSK